MKKIIIPLIFLVVAIPFFILHFSKSSQVGVEINKEVGEKEMKKVKETSINKDIPKGYNKIELSEEEKREIFGDYPIKAREEMLREKAEQERKRALGIKENLEWLQEDIEIDYVNQKEKMIEPFKTIGEEDVGWDIQTVNSVDFYNLEKINNYLPVQLKVEQIAKGMFQGKIKSVKMSVPNGKEQSFYLNSGNGAQAEPNGDNVWIYMFLTLDNSGTFTLGGNDKEGYKGYVEGGGLGGRHIIKLDKDGKGYVYNIYN